MKVTSLFAAAAMLAAPVFPVGAVTLNFDGPVDLDISNDYPGFSFSAPGTGTGPVRTWATSIADTPGNVLGLSGQSNFFALNQQDGNAIDVVFTTPLNFVSVRAAFSTGVELYSPFGGSLPFMAVYNSDVITAANRIGLVSWDSPGDACFNSNTFCISGWDTLDFTSTTGDIRAIRITGAAPPAGFPTRRASFDTLVATPVPEPESAVLMTLGVLAGLTLTLRRKPQPR